MQIASRIAFAAVMLAASSAHAALTPVTSFGTNPGNLAMYEYVPAALPASPAVVVAMHGCTQTATAYYQNSGWPKYADRLGFVVVFPEQRTGNNANRCFTWFQPSDTTRGQGEALSIKQMVDNAVARPRLRLLDLLHRRLLRAHGRPRTYGHPDRDPDGPAGHLP